LTEWRLQAVLRKVLEVVRTPREPKPQPAMAGILPLLSRMLLRVWRGLALMFIAPTMLLGTH
jgi:hypothetical protein